MTKPSTLLTKELRQDLAEGLDFLDEKKASAVLARLEEVVTDALNGGRVVSISGFLRLEAVDKPERRGRNPQSGETIMIPAKRVVKVRPLKRLQDAVAQG